GRIARIQSCGRSIDRHISDKKIVATVLDGEAIKVCIFVGMLVRLSQIVRAGENMGLRLA
ncbi:MAG: hypothetical protein WCF80_00110, partial [Pseudolabrys sp.]